jgi:thiamine pyrophosphokinase
MSETVFSPFSFKSDAVIIDNGEYPTHSIPLQWISDAKFTVCCDGAADTYLKQGKVPDVIIGDGDSISQENAELYRDIIHHVKDQETNDQTKAVNYLLSLDKHNIVIVAATGDARTTPWATSPYLSIMPSKARISSWLQTMDSL